MRVVRKHNTDAWSTVPVRHHSRRRNRGPWQKTPFGPETTPCGRKMNALRLMSQTSVGSKHQLAHLAQAQATGMRHKYSPSPPSSVDTPSPSRGHPKKGPRSGAGCPRRRAALVAAMTWRAQALHLFFLHCTEYFSMICMGSDL